MLEKERKKIKRHKRVRAKIIGTANRPRLCVFRSNRHIVAQLIDDAKRETLMTASDLNLKTKGKPKVEVARLVGELIGKEAKEKKIAEVIFDRGGYKYHGRIKALAEGARAGGLKF